MSLKQHANASNHFLYISRGCDLFRISLYTTNSEPRGGRAGLGGWGGGGGLRDSYLKTHDKFLDLKSIFQPFSVDSF